MMGSARQNGLLAGRRIILSLPMTMPATDAAKAINDFLGQYVGDAAHLLFGYWDYGGEIVMTAPETGMLPCPRHAADDCSWCFGTRLVTDELHAILCQSPETGGG